MIQKHSTSPAPLNVPRNRAERRARGIGITKPVRLRTRPILTAAYRTDVRARILRQVVTDAKANQ